ncbi:ATP-binding protein [Streptosporangium sp. NBC_01755]|uniref:ATP-binding protein n=1 Tax=Streptosporangium sp. NBC_01755 TaxID=2975949 RepID=UPI002DD7A27A|nr:ATP-binding protein [Streptosporangium sp. NBC_01755]WSD00176.1 ATP-binding protein [Streptosporangium sp. NBC_01755]
MPPAGDIPSGAPHHPAESPAPPPDHNWKPFTPAGAATPPMYGTGTTGRNTETPRQDTETPGRAGGATEPYSGTTTGRDSDAAGQSDIRALVKVLRPGSASRRARAVVRDVLQRAGLPEDDIDTAELIVAELAANAEKHARPPYELRVFSLDGIPSWCEIVDGDPNTHEIRLILNLLHSVREIGLPLLAENGRGLLLAHQLSGGHCQTYPAITLTTATPGKAVAFALPTLSGNRLIFPPRPDLHPGLAELRRRSSG